MQKHLQKINQYVIISGKITKEVKILNQILSVENTSKNKKKVKNNGPVEIKSILKFFSICLIVFGIFLIGTGSYSMYEELNKADENTKPTISVEETSETEITIKITHDKQLSKVLYSWNDEEEKEIQTNSRKEVEQIIEIPTGENTLKITATDINGQESVYQKEYTRIGDINIEITKENGQVKITATAKNNISYITYRWDENEETKIDINSKETEQLINVPEGLHTLTVIAVDENNKTETKEREVEGVSSEEKPKIEITADTQGENFIIKVSDENGLDKIEFLIDETHESSQNLNGTKEIEFTYPIHEGTTKIKATVYNIYGITETSAKMYRK